MNYQDEKNNNIFQQNKQNPQQTQDQQSEQQNLKFIKREITQSQYNQEQLYNLKYALIQFQESLNNFQINLAPNQKYSIEGEILKLFQVNHLQKDQKTQHLNNSNQYDQFSNKSNNKTTLKKSRFDPQYPANITGDMDSQIVDTPTLVQKLDGNNQNNNNLIKECIINHSYVKNNLKDYQSILQLVLEQNLKNERELIKCECFCKGKIQLKDIQSISNKNIFQMILSKQLEIILSQAPTQELKVLKCSNSFCSFKCIQNNQDKKMNQKVQRYYCPCCDNFSVELSFNT